MSKLVLLLTIIFLPSSALYAQTAQLSGAVRDPSNAAIPRATVEASDKATGARYRTQTNETGSYTLPYLTPGTYDLTVEASGFRTIHKADVRLDVAQRAQLDFALGVGAVDQSVDVEAGAPLVNTQDAAVKTTIDRQFVANLPLNGRSFQSLLQLVPGVVPNKVASEGGQFSVNGQRAGSNYFTVDGVSANVGISTVQLLGQGGSGALPGFTVLGTTNNLISVDALEEFSVHTSSYAPEFGRTPGAQVSLVTRSGTNDFHGTVFDYFRNDVLDANDWMANRNGLGRPPLRHNQFGGVFGGPVLLPGYSGCNRTFFFFSYEGLRLRQPQAADSFVPTMAAREAAPDATRPLLEAYPRPTGPDLGNGLAPFVASYSTPSRVDTTSIRFDHHPTSRWSVFGRYQDAPSVTEERQRRSQPQQTMLANVRRTRLDTQGVTLGGTVVMTPTLVNDLRYNLTHTEGGNQAWLDRFGGATPPPDTVLFPPFASSRNGYVNVNLVTLGPFAVGTDAKNRQWQNNIVEGLSWTSGTHALKFGADWRQINSHFGTAQRSQYRPTYNFSGIAGVQSARLQSALVNTRDTVELRFHNLSLYVQDTWRVSQHLTLTYGLRYEWNPPPGGVDTANQPFTINSLNPLSAVALAPPGTPLYQTTMTNFAPRLGVAYQLVPAADRGLVLRAGWGLFYDMGTGVIANASGAFPFLRTKRLPLNTVFPLNEAASAPLPIDAPPPYDLIRAFDPQTVLPRTHQFNVTLEQTLGASQTLTASYVGALGRRLLRQENISSVSPTIMALQLTTNRDRSDYHALQLQFRRRFFHGVHALASYTWAKALDTASTDTALLPRADRLDPRRDRGPADFDVRHTLTAAFSWSLPSVAPNGLFKAALSGWSLDGTVMSRSATPITVTAFRSLDLGPFAVRPDWAPGIPLYLEDSVAPGGRRINDTSIAGNPNQRGPFAFPTEGRQGNLGRNTLRGLAFHQVDLAIWRKFRLTEHLALQMRAEAFNLFNHPNFADPSGSLGSLSPTGAITFNSSFGRATTMLRNGLPGLNPLYQIGGPRSMQLALKLLFGK